MAPGAVSSPHPRDRYSVPVTDQRILFVHAHPDDESIGTGATMAYYAARGAHVTLVTCTLGEEGEIHVPELAQLEAAGADQLGGVPVGGAAPPRAAPRAPHPPVPRGGGPGPGPGADEPPPHPRPPAVLGGAH